MLSLFVWHIANLYVLGTLAVKMFHCSVADSNRRRNGGTRFLQGTDEDWQSRNGHTGTNRRTQTMVSKHDRLQPPPLLTLTLHFHFYGLLPSAEGLCAALWHPVNELLEPTRLTHSWTHRQAYITGPLSYPLLIASTLWPFKQQNGKIEKTRWERKTEGRGERYNWNVLENQRKIRCWFER